MPSELLHALIDRVDERRVLGRPIEAGLINRTEKLDRIVVRLLPQIGVELLEERRRPRLPCPPEVMGDLEERRQGLRKGREHAERRDFRRHGVEHPGGTPFPHAS
jgi:hypothetical protein